MICSTTMYLTGQPTHPTTRPGITGRCTTIHGAIASVGAPTTVRRSVYPYSWVGRTAATTTIPISTLTTRSTIPSSTILITTRRPTTRATCTQDVITIRTGTVTMARMASRTHHTASADPTGSVWVIGIAAMTSAPR